MASFTDLIEPLYLSPKHDHHVPMHHGHLQNILIHGFMFKPLRRKDEFALAFGSEAHKRRRAQRKCGYNRAKLALAIIMVLQKKEIIMIRS